MALTALSFFKSFLRLTRTRPPSRETTTRFPVTRFPSVRRPGSTSPSLTVHLCLHTALLREIGNAPAGSQFSIILVKEMYVERN